MEHEPSIDVNFNMENCDYVPRCVLVGIPVICCPVLLTAAGQEKVQFSNSSLVKFSLKPVLPKKYSMQLNSFQEGNGKRERES